MSQPALDFTVPNAYAKRGPVQARHASRKGAESVAGRAETQTARYIALLQAYPDGLTDWRAAELLGVERTSVNARRSPLVKAGVVVPNGFHRDDHSDVANTRWQLVAMRKKEPTSPGGENPASDTAASAGIVTRTLTGVTGAESGDPADGRLGGPRAATSRVNQSVAITGERDPGQNRNAAITASPMSLTQLCGVKEGTRVRLADGRFGQLTTVSTHRGEAYIYVFSTRGYRAMPPERLIDRRETDGELVEVTP